MLHWKYSIWGLQTWHHQGFSLCGSLCLTSVLPEFLKPRSLIMNISGMKDSLVKSRLPNARLHKIGHVSLLKGFPEPWIYKFVLSPLGRDLIFLPPSYLTLCFTDASWEILHSLNGQEWFPWEAGWTGISLAVPGEKRPESGVIHSTQWHMALGGVCLCVRVRVYASGLVVGKGKVEESSSVLSPPRYPGLMISSRTFSS